MSAFANPSRFCRRAVGALVVMLALAATAVGGPGPGPLGVQSATALGETPGNAVSPRIAVNDRGDAIAVWYRTLSGFYRVEARYRPAGGTWGDVKVLSAGSNAVLPVDVAIDASGDAAVIWLRNLDGANRIQTARRSAGGVWSAVKTLSPVGVAPGMSEIAMDAAGNITAAWEIFGGIQRIQVARKPVGGSWTAPVTISPEGQGAAGPSLAASPGGTVMLAWTTVESVPRIKAVRRPPTGPWSPVMNASPAGQSADSPAIAFDSQDRATLAWRAAFVDTTGIVVRRHTSQGWGTAERVSPESKQASSFPSLAVSAAGDAYVAWVGVDHGHNSAQLVRRPANGFWSDPLRLSDVRRTVQDTDVAVNSRGDAVATWSMFTAEATWLESSFKPLGQQWGLAVDVTDPDTGAVGGPDAGVANDGTVHLVSIAFHNSIYRVQALRRTPNGIWSSPDFLSPIQNEPNPRHQIDSP